MVSLWILMGMSLTINQYLKGKEVLGYETLTNQHYFLDYFWKWFDIYYASNYPGKICRSGKCLTNARKFSKLYLEKEINLFEDEYAKKMEST